MFDTVLNQFQVTLRGFSIAILAVATILTAGCLSTDRRDYLGLKVEKNTEPRIGEFISFNICPVDDRHKPVPRKPRQMQA